MGSPGTRPNDTGEQRAAFGQRRAPGTSWGRGASCQRISGSTSRTSRAGAFPPPPSEQYTELDLVFTLNELMGR